MGFSAALGERRRRGRCVGVSSSRARQTTPAGSFLLKGWETQRQLHQKGFALPAAAGWAVVLLWTCALSSKGECLRSRWNGQSLYNCPDTVPATALGGVRGGSGAFASSRLRAGVRIRPCHAANIVSDAPEPSAWLSLASVTRSGSEASAAG